MIGDTTTPAAADPRIDNVNLHELTERELITSLALAADQRRALAGSLAGPGKSDRQITHLEDDLVAELHSRAVPTDQPRGALVDPGRHS